MNVREAPHHKYSGSTGAFQGMLSVLRLKIRPREVRRKRTKHELAVRLMMGAKMDDGRFTIPYRAFGLFHCRWSSSREIWTTEKRKSGRKMAP